MFKRIWLYILVVAVLLSACKGANQPTTVAPATSEKPTAATSVPTRIAVSLPTAADTATVEPTVASTMEIDPGPGCTLISYLPDDPSGSLYPPVTAKDWVQGPATAQVTVIEYGDFQ